MTSYESLEDRLARRLTEASWRERQERRQRQRELRCFSMGVWAAALGLAVRQHHWIVAGIIALCLVLGGWGFWSERASRKNRP
jgi:hypothetical protein